MEALDDVARRVAGYLADGVSVELVGLRGSGRSQTVRRATDLLGDDGVATLRLAGVVALRDRPLAALAASGLPMPAGPTTVAGAAAAILDVVTSRDRVVVAVDDADDLDDASIGALMVARTRQPFAVVASGRPSGRRRSTAPALTTEMQPGVRVTLAPLRFEQLHRLVHDLLGGPVDPTLVARVATKSGGLPGLVRAVVDTGRRTGRLVERGGMWVCPGELWSDELAHAVEPLLVDVDDDGLDVLTILSVVGAVDLVTLAGATSWDALNRLDDAGLLTVAGGPDAPVVGVYPPIVAEHVRRTTTATRRTQAALAARRTDPHPRPTAPGEPGDWSVGGGAVLLSRRVTEHWADEVRARRTAWESHRGPATAVPLLTALHAASATRTAIDDVVARTDLDLDDDESRALLATWHATYQAFDGHDVGRATATLRSEAAHVPAFDAFLRSVEAHLRFVRAGRPADGLLAPPAPDEHRFGAEGLDAVGIEVALAAGRPRAALAALEPYAPHYPFFARHGDICRGLGLVLAGQVDDGVAWALDRLAEMRDQLDPGPIQAHAYVAGLGLALAGRLQEFEDLLADVLTLAAAPTLHTHYQAGLLCLASVVAGWRGRTAYAQALAAQVRDLSADVGPFPVMLPSTLLALVRGAGGDDVHDELWAAADECFTRGYLASGLIVGIASVERRPVADRAERLAHEATATDGLLLPALGRYALALRDGDPAALAACGDELARAGSTLFAARAGIGRARALRRQGDLAGAAVQAVATWREFQEFAPEQSGLFLPLARAVDLSPREREIAAMVGAGMVTAAIAAALHLSVRTVENHIFSAYRKVGVDNRDALAEAVTTWLVAPED